MDKLKKLIKEFSLSYDVINLLLGTVLLIFLVLVFRYPGNRLFLLIAFTSGGFMNIINGLKFKKNSKKKSMGMSFILFGMMVIFIGFFIA
ncbi:MAG: hypothetical protein E7255_07295 [Lachnospiraceae bacterium]|jgi:hypothetical protein|nr:hypothetical protein [Lachnospiraceae bacterium]